MMKKFLILLVMTAFLTGCESLKYAITQPFSETNEPNQLLKEDQPHEDNMLANADDWIKKHLW